MPEKPELKIREYETFRAYYCSVCKSISRTCGQLARLVLSYDATFLAVLLSSLAGGKNEVRPERCPVHPVKKRPVITGDVEIIEYAADINVLLAYYNLRDDVRDEGSLKSSVAAFVLKRSAVRAGKRHPEKMDAVKTMLEELGEAEKEKCPSMDKAAEPFARLMENIVGYKVPGAGEKDMEALGWIGYNLGKWLYIMDASDDLEDDLQSGSYNPLVCQFGKGDKNAAGISYRMKGRVEFNLTYTLNEISKGIGLLNIKRNRGIIENIVYMGMLRKTEQILETGSCKKVEESL